MNIETILMWGVGATVASGIISLAATTFMNYMRQQARSEEGREVTSMLKTVLAAEIGEDAVKQVKDN